MEANQNDYHHMYKIVLLGDQGVGKTHLLHKFMGKEVARNLNATIGVEFANQTVDLKEGGQVKV